MSQLARLLPLLLFATTLGATPLEDWRESMNKPLEIPLPPLWVTWDESAERKRDLKERDWQRYYDKLKSEADRHEHFLRKITGDERITLNQYGNRVDNSPTATIHYTAKQWILIATDTADPLSKPYRNWFQAEECGAARVTESATQLLILQTQKALAEQPSARLENFARELARASQALENIAAGATNTAELRALRRFILQYAH